MPEREFPKVQRDFYREIAREVAHIKHLSDYQLVPGLTLEQNYRRYEMLFHLASVGSKEEQN